MSAYKKQVINEIFYEGEIFRNPFYYEGEIFRNPFYPDKNFFIRISSDKKIDNTQIQQPAGGNNEKRN